MKSLPANQLALPIKKKLSKVTIGNFVSNNVSISIQQKVAFGVLVVE